MIARLPLHAARSGSRPRDARPQAPAPAAPPACAPVAETSRAQSRHSLPFSAARLARLTLPPPRPGPRHRGELPQAPAPAARSACAPAAATSADLRLPASTPRIHRPPSPPPQPLPRNRAALPRVPALALRPDHALDRDVAELWPPNLASAQPQIQLARTQAHVRARLPYPAPVRVP